MSRAPIFAALGGLALALAALGGLTLLHGDLDARAAAARAGDWRPPCVKSLGPAYQALDLPPLAEPADPQAQPPRTYLLGVDRSGSNQDVADDQLAAAAAFARARPLDEQVGVLLISDRSDRSSTPDMTLETALAVTDVQPPPLPCAPDCRPRSLFEQMCFEQLQEALGARASARQLELTAHLHRLAAERAARVDAWSERIAAAPPATATSLLAFFAKVGDLPAVRRSPGRTTLIVLSDLEEAKTADRRLLDAYHRATLDPAAPCPAVPWQPSGLAGLEILLLQTHSDGQDPELWGRLWERLLRCSGAHVSRRRYSPSIALGEYLAERT
jgi:hypothetical protein